jgi:acetyl esterase/lipase
VAHALWSLWTPLRVPTREPTHRALAYRGSGRRGIAPLADVYLPECSGPHPSVVLIHGGSFLIGSRRMKPIRYLATRLVEAGFAVAALDYRMIFRGGRLDESVEDVETMIQWWQTQADRFALDVDQVTTLGFSAGAALMWLSAANLSIPPRRLVSLYGVYDFAWLSGRRAAWLRRKLLRSGDVAVWRQRSPLMHAACPSPALIIHGDEDRMVPVAHAKALATTRERAGLPTTLQVVAGARHGFLNDAGSVMAESCVAEIVSFVRGD